MYHLKFIKYDVYGVYTYSFKKLGTRTLVRIVISIITLFLGKNRFNLHHFTCNIFSRNITPDTFADSLQYLLFGCLQCPLAFWCSVLQGVSMDPGSSLKAGARGRSSFCGALLRKRTNTKLAPMV